MRQTKYSLSLNHKAILSGSKREICDYLIQIYDEAYLYNVEDSNGRREWGNDFLDLNQL